MTLTPTPYYNSPFQPGVTQDAFMPDQLIGGDLKIVTHAGRTLLAGQYYKRGTVLGLITASQKYTIATSAAADGSQVPCNILVDDVDATLADALGGIYAMGEFNANAVILGAGITLAAAKAALEVQNIYLKTAITASDPT
ncbi:MAG: head decoration protein [Pseudomonadota bacterium]|jgi:hypothetical protein|nr:head decoration protein [Pseudomonadota bacterium]